MSIWPISSFFFFFDGGGGRWWGGGFMGLSQLSIDEVKAGHCCFESLGREAVFSPKFKSAARFFPPT